MPFGKKSPKSELHEFFQLHPGNPVFDIQSKSNPPAEPLFQCILTCPAIGGPQGLPEQNFTGQGRNKKTAEQYASEKALEFLRQRGLMAPAMVQMPEQKLPLDLQRQLASTPMVPVSLLLCVCSLVFFMLANTSKTEFTAVGKHAGITCCMRSIRQADLGMNKSLFCHAATRTSAQGPQQQSCNAAPSGYILTADTHHVQWYAAIFSSPCPTPVPARIYLA